MLKSSYALVAVLFVSAFALAKADVSAAAQTKMSELKVTTAFMPDPPTSNGDDTLVVVVKNAAGAPVTGAKVRIATGMPTMSMKGVDLVARDRGNGKYTATTRLGYATTWSFDVTVDAPGEHGAAHITRVVH